MHYTGSFPQGTRYQTATLNVAGLARKVELYLPASLPAHPPLVMAFHGTNDDAKDNIEYIYADDLADGKSVVVASPWARKMTVGDWDDHAPGDVYWETYPNVSPSKNADLLLVQAIIQEAVKAYGVNKKKVYALGHSNGAFFAILTATSMPNSIAGFGDSCGGLVQCAKVDTCGFVGTANTCSALAAQSGWCSCSGPEKPGPLPTTGRKPAGYLHHGNQDTTISIYHGCALAGRMQALGYPTKMSIEAGGQHGVPYNFALDAWSFISQYALP